MTLRDHLIQAARAGDALALEALIGAVPPTLPAAARRCARDRCVLAVAVAIAASVPDVSCRRLAELVAAAGAAVGGGAGSVRHILPMMAGAEAAAVEAEITEALRWQDGRPWPAWRTVFDIIARAGIVQ